MKAKLSLIPVSFFSLLSLGATTTSDGVILTCDPIGPFVVNNQNYSLKVKVSAKRSISNVQERIYLGPSGEDYIYIYTTSIHSINIRRSVTSTLPMPLGELLTTKGVDCKIAVLVNGEIRDTYEFKVKPISYPEIPVSQYQNTPYVIEDVIVDPLDYTNKHTESYRFEGFLDYFDCDYYYHLSIDNLSINYNCFASFPGCEASLHFVDYNRLFPYLDNDDEIPSFDIPLKGYYEDNAVVFDFLNTMYVNPKTLDMSFTPREGMVQTYYFYLPRNKLPLLLDQDFYLNVSNFGYGKSSFNWKIRYLNNRNLIGDCDNSEYCVVGEVN